MKYWIQTIVTLVLFYQSLRSIQMTEVLQNNKFFDYYLNYNFEDFLKFCKFEGNQQFLAIVCKNISNQMVLKKIFDKNLNNRFGKLSITESSVNTIDTYFLPKNIGFELISVKKTNLKQIDLKVFIDSFKILKRLEIIHSDLVELPFDRSYQLRQLQHLDLYYNSLTTIPDYAFEKMVELKTIDLSFNQISYVGSFAFYFNDKLEYLDLKYNRLKVVNNYAFALSKPNPRLTLDLTNNKMFYLSDGVFSRQSPLLLNLSSNSLTKFEEKHFWPILKAIIQYNGVISVESQFI